MLPLSHKSKQTSTLLRAEWGYVSKRSANNAWNRNVSPCSAFETLPHETFRNPGSRQTDPWPKRAERGAPGPANEPLAEAGRARRPRPRKRATGRREPGTACETKTQPFRVSSKSDVRRRRRLRPSAYKSTIARLAGPLTIKPKSRTKAPAATSPL